MIFVPKMVKLWLGIGAKVWALVSHLHPKDVISKAYPNYTKADKAESWLLHPKAQKRFVVRRRWLWCFVIPPNTYRHKNSIVGHYIALFMSQKKEMNQDCSLTNSMSENNSEEAQEAQQDPNNTVIMENSQENQH